MNVLEAPSTSWRQQDPKTWTWKHKVLSLTDIWHNDNKDHPVHSKTDKIPYLDPWSVSRWIITHAAWPIAVHATYNTLIGPLPYFGAVVLYSLGLLINLLLEIYCLKAVASKTGFLDGDRYSREKVSDAFIDQIFASFAGVVVSRSALTVCLAYRPSAPIAFSPWIFAELVLYPVILDFFYYTYHRATHEIDGLWKYHRTHHLTKHPNPLLSSLAGVEQEAIEFAIIPFLTYVTFKMCGFPLGFYDWWLCISFNLFTEACWHSGMRVMLPLPGPCAPLMKIIGCELVLEDHDLHHRNGWRTAGNYGKVTRLWDRIFGTCMNRIESNWDNVDYSEPLIMPWL